MNKLKRTDFAISETLIDRIAELEKERDKWIRQSEENWACAVRRKSRLDAIAKLTDKWRKQCGNKKTSTNRLKMDCADDLEAALKQEKK